MKKYALHNQVIFEHTYFGFLFRFYINRDYFILYRFRIINN